VRDYRETGAVVRVSLFRKNIDGPVRDREIWRTIANYWSPNDVLKQALCTPNVFTKSIRTNVIDQFVTVPMTCNLMARCGDFAHEIRMALCNPAKDEAR
jgi:hypothetical protein